MRHLCTLYGQQDMGEARGGCPYSASCGNKTAAPAGSRQRPACTFIGTGIAVTCRRCCWCDCRCRACSSPQSLHLLQVTQSINRLMFTNFCLRVQSCSNAAMQRCNIHHAPSRPIFGDLHLCISRMRSAQPCWPKLLPHARMHDAAGACLVWCTHHVVRPMPRCASHTCQSVYAV